MKLIWHIVKKDLRRLWLPVALWALLVAAQIGVGMNLLLSQGTADVEWFTQMSVYSVMLLTLDLLFAYVLVAALVQDDSLVGTNLFWRTRPISGRRLLGAKLLAAAIMFGALPTLIWLPWWLSCGYGWREVAGAIPEILGEHAVAVMAGLLVAVLTDTLGRFLGWTIILAATVATLGMDLFSATEVDSMRGMNVGLFETRAILAFAVLMLAIGTVVNRQFLHQRAARAFGLAAGGFGVATLICTFWPWDLSPLWWPAVGMPPQSEQSQALANQVTITFDQARFWQNPNERFESPLAVGLSVKGVPAGLGLSSRYYATQTWRSANGAIAARSYPWGLGTAGSPEAVLGLPEQKTDLGWLKDMSDSFQGRHPGEGSPGYEIQLARGGARGLIAQSMLTHAEVAAITAKPMAYAITAQFALFRPEVQIELPLHPSDRHWLDKTSVRIVETEKDENYMRVAAIESRPTSWADGLRGLSPFRGREVSSFPAIESWTGYRLVNRDRGNMSVADSRGPAVRVGTVEIARRISRFSWPKEWHGEALKWVRQPDWFEHATLVKTTAQEVARFTREIKVEHFEAQP
jgi:hypothetical protein